MTLRLNGDSSGFTEIKAADAAGDNSIKLPASNGGANQLLKNGSTAGELEYESNVTVDSSGRLCVGNASPDFAKTTNIQGSSGSILMLSSEDTTGVQDTTASIEFRINDGASGRATAEIRAGKESATAGNQNSYISFVTRDTSNRERIRIASNGALKLLSDCPGIDFSGIQTNAAGMTSETLDSYEEGTFDAGFGNNIPGNINYTRQAGFYVKVGKLVQCVGTFSFTTYTSFPAGFSTFTLPFAHEELNGEGDAFSQSWWAILGGGQVRQTVGGANCFLFGPLGQSGFSNIFTDGVSSGLANANFNTIFNGNQGEKTFRYHHIYRAA